MEVRLRTIFQIHHIRSDLWHFNPNYRTGMDIWNEIAVWIDPCPVHIHPDWSNRSDRNLDHCRDAGNLNNYWMRTVFGSNGTEMSDSSIFTIHALFGGESVPAGGWRGWWGAHSESRWKWPVDDSAQGSPFARVGCSIANSGTSSTDWMAVLGVPGFMRLQIKSRSQVRPQVDLRCQCVQDAGRGFGQNMVLTEHRRRWWAIAGTTTALSGCCIWWDHNEIFVHLG